jgi:hypothetical protein
MNSRRRVNSTVMRLFMNSRGARIVAGLAFIGTIVFIVGIYLLLRRVVFLANASAYNAPVVSVSQEYVSSGHGRHLAYVPTVEVRDSLGHSLSLKVDTSDESPVYSIGQQMRVVCNPTRGCIENTFGAKWGDSLLDFLISLVCFVPLLYFKLVPRDAEPTTTPLNLRHDA